MLCAIYKSSKKADTYLYIPKKDYFEDIPKALMETFGQPIFVTLLALNKKPKVAGKPSIELQEILVQQGFYLQLPPKPEDLLAKHRKDLGLSETPDVKFN
ncbi:YcgL domain-containing protein [Glaciecola sp. KUL10]|jgi:uncharacterized protein YcgL (UPF0745 family)|uniref:YcgL domain-containing protein n=1 Tax=Glaciecola sp. (strain KUL10) TaxID=2161813 RepID=UPI000D7850D2|nr:YcgL domain-containing protein [Glaciecola sp. KUL10]GBL03438.1 hypothetical protein KUL10_07260 [Glaciecola sp. KUL10]